MGHPMKLRRNLRLAKINEDLKIQLTNKNNVQYSGAFSVGGQALPVIFDTGSFEIIVLSTMCGDACAEGHVVYDKAKSTTFAEENESVTAQHFFGSGPVTSQKGREDIRLGPPESPYEVNRMPFWQVVHHGIKAWNANAAFSGIVGLGHPSYIPEGYTAEPMDGGVNDPDETLLSSLGVWSFALCLQRGSGAPGWLSLGPSVQALVGNSSQFSSLSVVGKVHWGVRLTSLEVPGVATATDLCKPSCGAIVDSGTSLIAVPPTALPLVEELQSMIRKDCSNLAQLPVLRFQLDGFVVELPPAAYVTRIRTTLPINFNASIWKFLAKGKFSQTRDMCFAGFMSLDKQSQEGPVWILGMPFLRYYYTIFDRKDKKIHVARASPTCAPEQSGSLFAASRPVKGTVAAVSGKLQSSSQAGAAVFTEADYQPTEVDIGEALFPPWAAPNGKDDGHFLL